MIKQSYYCMNCFKDFEMDLTEVAEALNKIEIFRNTKYKNLVMNIDCPYCRTNSTYEVDDKMIPVIRYLNEKGYETFAHCSGHYESTPISTGSSGTYIGVYVTPEELDIIKALPLDKELELFDDHWPIDPINDIWSYRVSVHCNNKLKTEQDLDNAVKKIFDFVSQFPVSDSFRTGMFASVIVEEE